MRGNDAYKSPAKQFEEPIVHIWVRFEAIKDSILINYPISIRSCDLEIEDPKRWVEVAADFTQVKLKDLTCDKNKVELIVEYFDVENNMWPMAKTDQTWKKFQIGDIISMSKLREYEYSVYAL